MSDCSATLAFSAISFRELAGSTLTGAPIRVVNFTRNGPRKGVKGTAQRARGGAQRRARADDASVSFEFGAIRV